MSQIKSTLLRRDGSNTVVGDVNMTKHKITHLDEPVAEDDAVTQKYVDNALSAQLSDEAKQYIRRDGSSAMTSTLNMGGHSISNVAQAVSAQGIVFKGADNITLAQLQEETKQYLGKDGISTVVGMTNMGGCGMSSVAEAVSVQDTRYCD